MDSFLSRRVLSIIAHMTGQYKTFRIHKFAYKLLIKIKIQFTLFHDARFHDAYFIFLIFTIFLIYISIVILFFLFFMNTPSTHSIIIITHNFVSDFEVIMNMQH